MSHTTFAVVMVALLASTAWAMPSAEDASARLHDLFRERHEWQMRQFPERAMARGDYSHADRITDNSLLAIEQRHRDTQDFLQRLHDIDRSSLSENDIINYELFELELSNAIAGHRYRTFLAPVSGRMGPQQSIPQMAERVRFQNVMDYENYLRRLEQTPAMVDDTIERMRLGLEEERTPPRVVLEGLPIQFHALLEGGGLSALEAPFSRFPASINERERAALRVRFQSHSMPMVRDALTRFGAFIADEYLPHCRESIDAANWPDGAAYYNHQLALMTTTDMTAQQIHELGLAEVARIRAEMMDVIRRSDFFTELHRGKSWASDDAMFDAFIDYLRTDPRFYHETEEDLLAGYRAICKEVDGHMPRFFKTLPRLPYGVRPIPRFMAPTQTTAYYQQGDIRNGTAGFFYANTYRLDQRPKYEMIALAIHEAVPGHHHQIALAQEIEDIPEFRREAWFTAFGEGWALYSERLGIEMGLYADPYDDFGRLLYEMWRACRLVVDPGMHALGWSREQAIDFMKSNTALSELNIITEIDRYIAWPGQATAYKIGELKIRELRAMAEQTLGDKFDVREFHDVVLLAGAVPLTVLERRVGDWVAGVGKK